MLFNTGWTLPHTKAVAITLRELAPFDKRLGTTQQAYEKAFAGVVNRILDEGYQVIALSTCTGIDSYNKDDRMVCAQSAPAHQRSRPLPRGDG